MRSGGVIMNAIETEIRNLKFYSDNQISAISSSLAEGYIGKFENEYRIAIPYDEGAEFYDEFVGIHLSTGIMQFEGKEQRVLYLHAKTDLDINKLVPIAYQFILISNRKTLIEDPAAWFDEWRKIFGDSVKRRSVFDVFGEMVAFREIYKTDKKQYV